MRLSATVRRTGLRAILPRWYQALPAWCWWLFFFVTPITWVAMASLGMKPIDPSRGAVVFDQLSLANYDAATGNVFFAVFLITIKTAGLGTLICFLVGFPVAYALATKVPVRWRTPLVFLLLLPYWTSFLLRTFAWRIILAPQGELSDLLRSIGLMSTPLMILDSNTAVQLGIVYNYLPIVILPIYVALDRIDPAFKQASMDLGAGRLGTFLQVTLPLAVPGIVGGVLLTFILAAGDYVVPAILGGAKGLMVGNLVALQVLASQNLPIGAAMAMVLIGLLAVVVTVVGTAAFGLRSIVRLVRGPAL